FRQGGRTVLSRINNLNDLRNSGVVADLAPGVAYRFRVSINIFNPVRGSTLHITPEPGTSGQSYSMSTGDLLDAVKANSYVFDAGGEEYWLLYGTDVDPNTDQLASTRSFLFIHENGLSSRAWPVAETSLPVDAPRSVTLDQTSIVAKRASDGFLYLYDSGGSLAAR
ncbi:MAG: hypothetical protein KGL53_11955, partial [Elusimicrobia bacterium]|nr:hypothetical protein [Elusimicrobiota bacterium]